MEDSRSHCSETFWLFPFQERSLVCIYIESSYARLFVSLELRVQFSLLVCCTYPSLSTVNKEKNRADQRASLRVHTRETQHRHWDRRGQLPPVRQRQHPPAGQSSSSHNLQTENWTLSTPLPAPQTENFPFRRMSMWHRSSNSQPYPAVLLQLQQFETPDMAQSGGCPKEALGTG